MSNQLPQQFEKILDSKVVGYLIVTIAALNLVSPSQIPKQIKWAVINPVVRIVSMFVIAYTITGDYIQALAVSVIINFAFYLGETKKEKLTLIDQKTNIMPGCINIKAKDILDMFKGDADAAGKAMYEIGVPSGVILSDENAPLVATYLVNHKQNVNAKCAAPM